MTRQEAVDFLLQRPADFAKMLGFTKLGSLHNGWIQDMVRGREDKTLQASRGTYKTTCVSVALAEIVLLLPNARAMFMRKTDDDVKEVIKQTKNILTDPHTQYLAQCIYGVNLRMLVANATELSTNLTNDSRGTVQLMGMGVGASLTGKHFDRIFTDDIVNVSDRLSKAERDHTKIIYQELQNIRNRGGRIYNTGTPWHQDDAFSIMPEPERFDCYHPAIREIISEPELDELRSSMVPSLFAANYELRFVASEDVIFFAPQTGGDPAQVEQGIMHLDSAFYGEDFTAWGIMRKHEDKYYLYGRLKRKHVEDCYEEIMEDYRRFMAGKLYNESNADKGMVGRDLRKLGAKVILYAEKQNKFIKIATYLKAIWKNLIFVEGTDREYIDQICDFNDKAEHDDAPDNAASLARLLYRKKESIESHIIW